MNLTKIVAKSTQWEKKMTQSGIFGRKILLTMVIIASAYVVWSALGLYKSQLHYVEVEVTRVVYENIPVTVEVPVVTEERIYYVVREIQITRESGTVDLSLRPTPESTPVGIPADSTVVYIETTDGNGDPVNQAHMISDPVGLRCMPNPFINGTYVSSQIVSWLDPNEAVEIVALPPDGFSQNMFGIKSLQNPNRVGWVFDTDIVLDTAFQQDLPRVSDLLGGCWAVPPELVGLQTPQKFFALPTHGVQIQLRCRPDESSGTRLNFEFPAPVLIEKQYGDWYFVRVWAPNYYDAPGWVKKADVGTVFHIEVPGIRQEEIEDFYKC